jgi:tetratricopeptide (TPR) repeat protein
MVRVCRHWRKKSGSRGLQPRPFRAVQPFVTAVARRLELGIACALLFAACGGARQGQSTTPGRELVEMEELHITAARGSQGYELDAYDAADLFKRGTELLNQKKCKEAVELYDRLVSEFATSQYASASFYNAGLCLQALGDFAGAAQRYSGLLQHFADSPDRKDAAFQLAEVEVQLERWSEVMAVVDELLARQDLSADERLEGMARRSQALLGQENFDEAERYARGALAFMRTRPKEDAIKDEFFAAACNYVLAESFRQREQKLDFPQGLEPQKQVLLHRAELLLEAQREYFNTISLKNLDNYYWAAASGYRIGNMYDELWRAIMAAPVPANLPASGHAVYHEELAKLIKPLIRHAIRYWEMTQMFIERTGITTSWALKIKSDLDRVRALLLEQPEGPGGLPTAPASAEGAARSGAAGASAGAPSSPQAVPATGALPATALPKPKASPRLRAAPRAPEPAGARSSTTPGTEQPNGNHPPVK